MDLKRTHDFIDLITDSEQSGFLSPETKDEFLDRAQWEFFTQSAPFFSKEQQYRDAFSKLVVKYDFSTIASGLISLPVDIATSPCYERLLSCYITYFDNDAQESRYKEVKVINEDELPARLDSQIQKPTTSDPVATEPSTGQIQLWPNSAMTGHVYYLRRPKKPKLAYTVSGRTVTYNVGNSQQLEWNEASINKIMCKAIQMAGVKMSDERIMQFTELKNSQGI